MKAELINLGRNAIRPPFYSRLNTMKNETPQKSVVLNSFSRAYVVRINRNTRVTIPSNFEETGNIGPKARHSIVCVCVWDSNSKRSATILREIGETRPLFRKPIESVRHAKRLPRGFNQRRFIADGTFTFSPTFPQRIDKNDAAGRKLARACVNVSTT